MMNVSLINHSKISQIAFIAIMATLVLSIWQFASPSDCRAAQGSIQDDYAIAANYYSRGDWTESTAAFEALIENYPHTDEAISAQFFLAEVMMQQQQFAAAYVGYQSYLRKFPDHEYSQRATFRLGEAAYRIKKYDIAIRLLEEFILANPHDELTEFALPYLGEMRLMRQEPQLAQRAFETALRMYPTSTLSNSCRLGLAKSLQRLGNDHEAKRFYDFLNSNGDDAMVGEANLQLGIISFGQVDYEKAELQLSQAIKLCELESARSEATYWLARTFTATQDYQRAVELLETVPTDDLPDKLAAAILFDGAVAATKIKDHKKALTWLAKLRQQYPNSSLGDNALKLEIDIHVANGDVDKTDALITQFRTKHKSSPMLGNVLEAEGRAHYANRRYSETITTFEKLLQQHSADSSSAQHADVANWYYFKSLGHLGLAEFAEAEKSLDLIHAYPQNDQLKPLVRIARATALFGQQKYKPAIENYRKYLQTSPKGEEAKRARAELTISLAETKQWKESSLAFDDLKLNHDKDPLVMGTAKYLAEKAYGEKQTVYAERWYSLMAESGTEEDTIARGLSGLAWMKIESADMAGAFVVFEKLLEKCPDNNLAGEAAMARAKHLEDTKQYQQAAQMYGLVVRRFRHSPMSSVAILRRAYSLQKIGGESNLDEAKSLLLEYVALPSNNPLADEALYQIGWIHRDLNEINESHISFVELVENFPASKYWSDAAYRLAKNAVETKDYKAANGLITQLLKRNDVPVEVVSRVLFLQGKVASTQNNWESVTTAMEGLIKRTSDDSIRFKAKYWLAESLYRQKKYKKAAIGFTGLTEQAATFDLKLKPWIVLRRSQCLGNNKQWPEAAAMATAAKLEYPDFEADYEFDFIQARSLEDSGKLVDARDAYQRVLDSPEGRSTETAAIAQWRIGETFFHQEKYVAAIKAYHRVDSLFTYPHWRSAALMQAGKCQENLRNNKHAIKLYTQLIETFPKSEFVSVARSRLNRLSEQAKLTTEKSDETKSRR